MVAVYRLRSLIGSLGAAMSLALVLAGCGGGASTGGGTALAPAAGCVPGSSSASSGCGTVLVALTDAEGDFTSYVVDVLSISLERANGTHVETLPATTRIDFAELTELSEIVSAATLAPGDIVGGRIRIDYSNAEVFVETNGAIAPAALVNSNGLPLGVVDVDVRLADRDRLVITRGRTALLRIDFDLAASHTVDTSVAPANVVAQPYLVAEVEPVEEKEIRVRGALIDVDTTNSTYEVRVRPWHHRRGDHGIITVHTIAATEYEIDGTGYTGQAGLEALAALPQSSLTVAFGTLGVGNRSFTADIVHAGESVGGGEFSAVHGNIVARTRDQIVVKGGIAVRRDAPAHFHRTVIVELGPNTGVSRVGSPGTGFDKDDLSVGQRIVAFGKFANPEVADGNPLGPDIALLMDATEGRVRMLVTHLHGSVNGFVPGQVNLNLRGIDRLGIDMFDFTGTGAPGMDADPADYEVATGSLALDALEIDRPVRVFGFVSPFGAAPPDFEGRTIVGPRDLRSALGIGWTETGTAAPFSVMTSDSLVLDLTNSDIGLRHHMLTGQTLVDLFDLPGSPPIVPTAGRGLYGIWEPGHVELFGDYADFVDEIAARLGASSRARSLAAYGSYDGSGNTLTAHHAVVHMLPAE